MLRVFQSLVNRNFEMQRPLMNVAQGQGDVELMLSEIAPSSPTEIESLAKVEVMNLRWTAKFVIFGLVLALVIPSALVFHVVAQTWQENPSGRYWLLMGLSFYIAAALKAGCEALTREFFQLHCLRIEIRRSTAKSLFEAVSATLAAQAEKSGETCSWDDEVGQEHDAVTGAFSVKYRFWATRPRNFCISVAVGGNEPPGQKLRLHVAYDPGTDIMCSRSGRMTSQARMVLSTPASSSSVLRVKTLLRTWLEASHTTWTNPTDGVVKIFALQQSSTDWVPEWKQERVKPCKSATGTGHSFYLESNTLQRIVSDAKLWSSSCLRVYMVSGPPGVGKSEFILWLASQLGLSIYRLSLSSQNLSDNLLAQLLSQTSISDNEILVQVDEVQETLRRWRHATSDKCTGVSAGGFCESIQGSTAMRCGVVILSGTPEIMSSDMQDSLPAVYRRIHITAGLTWLKKDEVELYFKSFLRSFVPGASDEVLRSFAAEFLSADSPWADGHHNISIDMLRQYFMQQITEASVKDIGKFSNETRGALFQVPEESHADFFALINNHEMATRFLQAYAPVGKFGTA